MRNVEIWACDHHSNRARVLVWGGSTVTLNKFIPEGFTLEENGEIWYGGVRPSEPAKPKKGDFLISMSNILLVYGIDEALDFLFGSEFIFIGNERDRNEKLSTQAPSQYRSALQNVWIDTFNKRREAQTDHSLVLVSYPGEILEEATNKPEELPVKEDLSYMSTSFDRNTRKDILKYEHAPLQQVKVTFDGHEAGAFESSTINLDGRDGSACGSCHINLIPTAEELAAVTVEQAAEVIGAAQAELRSRIVTTDSPSGLVATSVASHHTGPSTKSVEIEPLEDRDLIELYRVLGPTPEEETAQAREILRLFKEEEVQLTKAEEHAAIEEDGGLDIPAQNADTYRLEYRKLLSNAVDKPLSILFWEQYRFINILGLHTLRWIIQTYDLTLYDRLRVKAALAAAAAYRALKGE